MDVDALHLNQTLVCSSLTGADPLLHFRQLLQSARRLSRELLVRGALLFDGERSLHLVEATPPCISGFIGALYSAAGHGDVQVLASRPLPAPTLPTDWCVGFVDPQCLDGWSAAEDDAQAEALLQRFIDLLRCTDCA